MIYTKNIAMSRNENVMKEKKKKKKLLVSVNVLGSVGPIRFLINEDDEVSCVVKTTLKAYARQGRIPFLGFDVDDFAFYSINAGFNTLNLEEKIGSMDANFLLCKKETKPVEKDEGRRESRARIGHGWRTRLRSKSYGLAQFDPSSPLFERMDREWSKFNLSPLRAELVRQ